MDQRESGVSRLMWARLVSNLLSPPLVWAVLAFPVAFRDAGSQTQAIIWASTYSLLVCFTPLIYIGWMVKRGKIGDLHMRIRKERLRPLLLSIALTTVAWWVLRLMGAPSIVSRLALFSLLQLAIVAGVTMVWQISLHATGITGAVVVTIVLFGLLPALIILPLVGVVAAARLKLKRHTPAQVVAGGLVGVIVPLIVFTLV